jgi:hypothetical protein
MCASRNPEARSFYDCHRVKSIITVSVSFFTCFVRRIVSPRDLSDWAIFFHIIS